MSGAAVERRAKRKWWIPLVVVVAVLVIMGVPVGIYAWSLGQTWDGQTEKLTDVFRPDEDRPPIAEPAVDGGQAQNILLLGSDSRRKIGSSIADLEGNRSDSIMVVHIPADRKSVYVMSLMRDSWVDIPGHGQAKINAALSFGGVPLAISTIEGLLGSRIDHVAVVDFKGFVGVTDALGGVDIDNPIAFTSSHRDGHFFPQGVQRLNGEQALAFVRERYAFSDGDFQRARNQQQFIKAIMGKALTPETLTNPARINDLVGAIAPHLAVDEGFNSGYLAQLGAEMRNVRVGNVSFFAAPTTGTGTSADGQSIVNIDWDKFPRLQQAFQTDRLDLYLTESQAAQ